MSIIGESLFIYSPHPVSGSPTPSSSKDPRSWLGMSVSISSVEIFISLLSFFPAVTADDTIGPDSLCEPFSETCSANHLKIGELT